VTISHAGSTGILTATTDAAPYDVAWPTGVAAGRLAIMWIANITLAAEVDLTSIADEWEIIGTLTGGDPGHTEPPAVGDANRSRITALYRVLTGAETGSFTLNTSPASSSACAVIDIYSTDASGFDLPPAFVSGSDDTHGNDRSITCGAWSSTLAAGDWVAFGTASDRDSGTVAISAQAITQSGATFGTVTNRSRNLNGTGNDSGVYSFDASVTAGTANAPTVSYTQASTGTQCGPGIVVRLRESGATTDAPAAAATATGAANNPAAGTAPTAGSSVTAAALDATTLIGAAANPATVVAAALNPSLSVSVLADCAAADGDAYNATFAIPSSPAGPRIVSTSPRGRITTSTPSRITTTSPRGLL
jgi:hypothetical protein